jgi:hypothetical protein
MIPTAPRDWRQPHRVPVAVGRSFRDHRIRPLVFRALALCPVRVLPGVLAAGVRRPPGLMRLSRFGDRTVSVSPRGDLVSLAGVCSTPRSAGREMGKLSSREPGRRLERVGGGLRP